MKRCPLCAEEIQDAAIKCKHCGSMIGEPPVQRAERVASEPSVVVGELGAPSGAPSPPRPAVSAARRRPRTEDPAPQPRRRMHYEGHPSWRAFLGRYAVVATSGLGGAALAYAVARWGGATSAVLALCVAAPLGVAAIAYWLLDFYRRSRVVRISDTHIETERGMVSKKIDVLELWRCRDLRYRQSGADRLLGIAHIEIDTSDVTTPHLEVVGLPASRLLFENVRDSIETQRQARKSGDE